MKELWAEKLREKLQGHEAAQVPEGLWAGIEQALDAPVRTVPFYRRKAVWSAAAILLVVVLGAGVARYYTPEKAALVAGQTATQEPEKETTTDMPHPESTSSQTEEAASASVHTTATKHLLAYARVEEEQPQTAAAAAEPLPEEPQPEEALPEETLPEEQHRPAPETETSPKETLPAFSLDPWENHQVVTPTKSSQKISLAVAASGINIDLDFLTDLGNKDFIANPGPVWNDQTANPGLPERPNYGQKPVSPLPATVTEEHQRPVSIGLQVGIPIANSWWVSTGFSYTYLKSTIWRTSLASRAKEEQELHFAGIPVTLNHSLYKDGNWHIYAGAGGKAELGKVVYFSLMATPGIQYHLKGGLNLYAEPSLQYNLPTSERYRTYYNMHPWMGDFRVGLRWIFNK